MIKSYIDNHIEGDDTFHIEEWLQVVSLVALWRMACSRTLGGKNTYSVYTKPPVFSRWLFDSDLEIKQLAEHANKTHL